MQSEVLSDPEIMGGAPCFRGTRVPVSFVFNWLHGEAITIDEFARQFPTVTRTQVEAVLVEASELLEKHADKSQAAVESAAR